MRNSAKVVLPGPTVHSGVALSDDFDRADGAIGGSWTGTTWTIATNKAVGTPTLGSELVTNGTFAADTNWTKETGWTIAAGVATYTDPVPHAASITQSSVVAQNGWYSFTGTVTANTATTLFPMLGNGGFMTAPWTGTGSHKYASYDPFTGTQVGFTGTGAALSTAAIDNVSFKAITPASLFASFQSYRTQFDASVALVIDAGTIGGLVLNLDSTTDPQNYVIAAITGEAAGNGLAVLTKCVAGVITELASVTCDYSANAVLRFVHSANSYSVYYNSILVIGPTSITDASVVNNTLHGIFSAGSGNTFNNYVGVVAF